MIENHILLNCFRGLIDRPLILDVTAKGRNGDAVEKRHMSNHTDEHFQTSFCGPRSVGVVIENKL